MKRVSRVGGLALLAAGALSLTACGSGFNGSSSASGDTGASHSTHSLNILIGSSGDAETNAVKSAVAAWSKQSGVKATVTAASDLAQQLSQGFTSGKPADVFYLSNDTVAQYAANGDLYPYASKLSNFKDFYPAIVHSFTYNGKVYAAPKDFSTLALVINTDAWKKAGLTDADIPTTWGQLEAVSKKLTTAKQVGLTMSPQFERIGVFMAQAGCWLTTPDGKKVTTDSPECVKALDYVKKLESEGVMKFSSKLGTGWGGEAFGKQLAAMTIEGNWIVGAMQSDYPKVHYRVVQLPAGPAGQGTMQYNGGWGIAAKSGDQKDAVQLVHYLTQPEQQLKFAKAFGVMPSVQSAAGRWKQEFPAEAAFLQGAGYAKSIPNVVGIKDVVTDFDAKLDALSTSDPKQILQAEQKNLEAIVH